MLDTVREVHTPEGVALRLPAAGPFPRALAWLIDLAIRFALVLVTALVLGVLGGFGQGLHLILMFLVTWAYPVVFEAMMDGQTPGKRALALRVISSNGAPIGWMAAFLRNLMRTADMLPLGYALGLSASLLDPWGRRLGDMVAGTMVVHAPRETPQGSGTAEAARAPALALRLDEQVAVIAFAERAAALTPQRQQELADLAAPVTGLRGQAGAAALAGVAHWLLGRRT
ncbi:RDD family protein [Luteimonas sp. RIT-PG2_3]